MLSERFTSIVQEESSDTMENEFEELLHAKDLLSRMRNFSSTQISHLARYAQLRLSREMEEGRIEVETELEVGVRKPKGRLLISADDMSAS